MSTHEDAYLDGYNAALDDNREWIAAGAAILATVTPQERENLLDTITAAFAAYRKAAETGAPPT